MQPIATAARSHGSRPARWRDFRSLAQLVFAALERSRRRRAVSALSDHLLRDIGLTRSDFMERATMFDHLAERIAPSRASPADRRGSAICPECDDGYAGVAEDGSRRSLDG